MGLKEKIIEMLEKDVEFSAGRIDLETVDEETREKLFEQFGEGNKNLTRFLKTAYNHGAPSQFCCSGHGYQTAYVNLKVTDENLEMLRNLGKVLSNHRVVTTFTDDHMRGKFVDYRGINNNISTEWLNLASKVLENPELYDSSNPSIYYHEQIYPSSKPLGFDLKKKLLQYLRGDKKLLAEKNGINVKDAREEDKTHSWDLTKEQKENIKPINPNGISNRKINEKTRVNEQEEQNEINL